MATQTLELPTALVERLRSEAERRAVSAEQLAEELLAAQLPPPPSERERLRAALRAAGLLTELSPEEKARAARSTATLEEVQAAFARAGGKPLSEIILEQRGPKE